MSLSQPAVAPPDLAACQSLRIEPMDPEEFGPPEAIPVPDGFHHAAATDVSYIAVSTLGGSTVCVDNTKTGEITEMEWFSGERFLGWQWWGYEGFGYKIVDRQGDGSIMDVGARPHFSPSANRMASLQVSGAGWGGLEGFAVWQVKPHGFDLLSAQVADEQGTLPQIIADNFGQWSFVGWRGEDCMQMALDPFRVSPADPRGTARRIYFADKDNAWEIMEGRCS
ncbi:hypothetical protein [Aurantiacibacter marinus]|nr:hypothetical protein [Aurantiacibacter marinus]